jgi:serine phosphatase RsbU (regulator of sigma subunit)/Tfp pilus assembly protein PilF
MKNALLVLFLLFSFSIFAFDKESDTTYARIKKIKSNEKRAIAFCTASEKAWLVSDYYATLFYSAEGLAICGKKRFLKTKMDLLNNRGIAFDYLGNYPDALRNYFAGLSIEAKVNYPYRKAAILANIGLIYSTQNKSGKALYYHEKALAINNTIKNERGVSNCLNNIAIVYVSKKMLKEALHNYLACISVDTKLNDLRGLSDDYNNIGLCYADLKLYDLALDYYNRSLEIRIKSNNPLGISEAYTNIGSLYYTKKDFVEARKFFLLSLPYSQKIGSKVSLAYAYEYLVKIEEKTNNPAEAFPYLQLYIKYKDSLESVEATRLQAETELNYKYDKEKEISRLAQDKKEAQSKLILYSVCAVLLLIIVFALVLLKRWKQAKEQQQIIAEKNTLLEIKNNEILDSINYAKRIQTAILPSKRSMHLLLENYFIFYQPKDVIAGDFYWMYEYDDLILFAVADCTGHGVPGALMSVICNNALNRSIIEFNQLKPGNILNKTREIIVADLSKSNDVVSDGMDIALCTWNKTTGVFHFSGANNPLWIVRKESGLLEETKGQKQPIGKHYTYDDFVSVELVLEKGDRLYLASDGFGDQFGGRDGKKFKNKQFKSFLTEMKDVPFSSQLEKIRTEFFTWKGEQEQVDDVCILGIEF